MQPVGKGRVGFAELGRIRTRTGRGESQLVPVCRPVGRRHATEAIDAAGIRENGLHQRTIEIQPYRPALQQRLAEGGYLVEVCVEPRPALQTAGTGDSPDIERDAGARRLGWGVSRYGRGVRA